MELILSKSPCISDFKEEPLSKVVRCIVCLHSQFIFVPVQLHCSTKVTTLKSTIKYQCIILLINNLIIRLQLLIVSIYPTTTSHPINLTNSSPYQLLLHWQLYLVFLFQVFTWAVVWGKFHAIIDHLIHAIGPLLILLLILFSHHLTQ